MATKNDVSPMRFEQLLLHQKDNSRICQNPRLGVCVTQECSRSDGILSIFKSDVVPL